MGCTDGFQHVVGIIGHPTVPNVAWSNTQLAAMRAAGFGVKAGTTTLLLIFRDGSHKNWVINVFSRPPEQIERELGCNYRTAWRMLNKVRNVLMEQDADPLSGEDEMALATAGGETLARHGIGRGSAAAASLAPAATRNPKDPTSWGKVGRNEPCPCGSGKKFKHCHGRYA